MSNWFKQELWAEIARIMAASVSAQRDWQEVRKKWKDFANSVKNRNATVLRDRLLTGAGPSTVPEFTLMEVKALAIIGEISCDGISGGIDLRRGDAGSSQARQSPSPAARTSQALRISQERQLLLSQSEPNCLSICKFPKSLAELFMP